MSSPCCFIRPVIHAEQMADRVGDVLPCGHSRHTPDPDPDILPFLHDVQTLLLFAPMCLLFVPGGQALHDAMDAAAVAVE